MTHENMILCSGHFKQDTFFHGIFSAVVAFPLRTSSPWLTPQYGKNFALTLLPEVRELCTLNLLTLSLTTANA